MRQNVKIAKELIKIAKDLMADWFPNDNPNSPYFMGFPEFDIQVLLEPIDMESRLYTDDKDTAGLYIVFKDTPQNYFVLDFDSYGIMTPDYGVLDNPSSIRKGDITIYCDTGGYEEEEKDFTQLTQQQQKQIIDYLKKYLNDEKNFEKQWESQMIRYKERREPDFDEYDRDRFW